MKTKSVASTLFLFGLASEIRSIGLFTTWNCNVSGRSSGFDIQTNTTIESTTKKIQRRQPDWIMATLYILEGFFVGLASKLWKFFPITRTATYQGIQVVQCLQKRSYTIESKEKKEMWALSPSKDSKLLYYNTNNWIYTKKQKKSRFPKE